MSNSPMLVFVKALLRRYGSDEIADRAAALAYYTVFSLGPLLFIVFGILSLIVQNESYKDRLLDNLDTSFGNQTANLVSKILNAQYLSDKAGPAFAIGAVGLILGAIGIFGQLQKSLNAILHVKVGPGAGIKTLIKQKLLSLGLVGLVSFLLLASLVASTTITVLTKQIDQTPVSGPLLRLFDFGLSVLILAFLLTLVYRTLPAVKLPWKVLYVSSIVVAILFTLGKLILGFIIGQNTTISAFGAAGSLIALLLWIFYSSQIIYLGAAGISLFVERHGIAMKPRYPGKHSVLRLEIIEEPLELDLTGRIKDKFTEGLKKGWRKNK